MYLLLQGGTVLVYGMAPIRTSGRGRNWCFTLNNPTVVEERRLERLDCKYIIYGRERGEGGTYHFQGFVMFKNARTMSAIKKDLGDRIHLELTRGSAQQNITYCSKDEEVTERGERPQPGKRSDLAVVRERILGGDSVRDVLPDCGTFQQLRFAECLSKYVKPPKHRDVEVIWLTGPTGCGKSRRAFQEAEDDYYVSWTQNGSRCWWDGYCGESVMIMDDYRGGDMKYAELLRLLDRYPLRLPMKGGSVWARWTKVIITSVLLPWECYSSQDDKDGICQLLRRISQILSCKDGEWSEIKDHPKPQSFSANSIEF